MCYPLSMDEIPVARVKRVKSRMSPAEHAWVRKVQDDGLFPAPGDKPTPNEIVRLKNLGVVYEPFKGAADGQYALTALGDALQDDLKRTTK